MTMKYVTSYFGSYVDNACFALCLPTWYNSLVLGGTPAFLPPYLSALSMVCPQNIDIDNL